VLVWTLLRKTKERDEQKRSHWLPTGDLGRADALLAQLADGSQGDVYAQVTLSPQDFGAYNRCEAGRAAGIVGLWAEIDIKHEAHKATNLPPSEWEARQLAYSLDVAPTEIVHSGHGLQPWWLFKAPWVFRDHQDRLRAAALSERFQAALRRNAEAKGWRLDGTADLARVLRVPGTVNYKCECEPVPVTLLEQGGPRYDPEDFPPLLGKVAQPKLIIQAPPSDREVALMALEHLSARRADAYADWLAVGMALHDVADDLLDAWDRWSRKCPKKYEEGACRAKWETFTRGGGVGLGSLVFWAREDGWQWHGGGGNGAGGGSSAAASQGRRPAAAIILDYLRKVYSPSFRRGDKVWSATLCAEVRRGEALARVIDSPLIDLLVDKAEEMPRDEKGNPRRTAAPRVCRDWSPVAWADLLRETPDEPEAEIDDAAEQDFRRRLAEALTRIVTLARHREGARATAPRDGAAQREPEPEREARSIIHWCNLFARAGPWAQVRSYFVWCRLVVSDPRQPPSLRVAIRPELLGQLGLRDLADLGQDRLADLCERYAVGQRCRAGRGGQRAIELDPTWLAGLLEAPQPAEGDGVTGDLTGAQARENGATPSPEESTP
jgi:hypothetical protein